MIRKGAGGPQWLILLFAVFGILAIGWFGGAALFGTAPVAGAVGGAVATPVASGGAINFCGAGGTTYPLGVLEQGSNLTYQQKPLTAYVTSGASDSPALTITLTAGTTGAFASGNVPCQVLSGKVITAAVAKVSPGSSTSFNTQTPTVALKTPYSSQVAGMFWHTNSSNATAGAMTGRFVCGAAGQTWDSCYAGQTVLQTTGQGQGVSYILGALVNATYSQFGSDDFGAWIITNYTTTTQAATDFGISVGGVAIPATDCPAGSVGLVSGVLQCYKINALKSGVPIIYTVTSNHPLGNPAGLVNALVFADDVYYYGNGNVMKHGVANEAGTDVGEGNAEFDIVVA